MIENRLELISPELVSRFKHASNLQLRVCALAACRFALDQTGLTNPIIDEGLNSIEATNYGDSLLRQKVEVLINELDEVQWAIQELLDEGQGDQASYLRAFGQARAAQAIYSALDANPFVAATEAIYEANAATDDLTNLKKVILLVLLPLEQVSQPQLWVRAIS